MYFEILIRENLFYVKRDYWHQNASQILQGTWHPREIRRKNVSIARNDPKVLTHQLSRCATKFGERSHEETLQKQDASAECVGFDENIYELKSADKATFYSFNGDKAIKEMIMAPAPTSKSPEEREFVAGASMHRMSKKNAHMNWILCEDPENTLWYLQPMRCAYK